MAAINKATPPTTAAPLFELVSVEFDAANTLTEETAIIANTLIDFTKLFILYFFITIL